MEDHLYKLSHLPYSDLSSKYKSDRSRFSATVPLPPIKRILEIAASVWCYPHLKVWVFVRPNTGEWQVLGMGERRLNCTDVFFGVLPQTYCAANRDAWIAAPIKWWQEVTNSSCITRHHTDVTIQIANPSYYTTGYRTLVAGSVELEVLGLSQDQSPESETAYDRTKVPELKIPNTEKERDTILSMDSARYSYPESTFDRIAKENRECFSKVSPYLVGMSGVYGPRAEEEQEHYFIYTGECGLELLRYGFDKTVSRHTPKRARKDEKQPMYYTFPLNEFQLTSPPD